MSHCCILTIPYATKATYWIHWLACIIFEIKSFYVTKPIEMEQLNEDNHLYFFYLTLLQLHWTHFNTCLKVTKFFFKEILKSMIWFILGKQSKHWKENKSLVFSENWNILSQYGHGCARCAKEPSFWILPSTDQCS